MDKLFTRDEIELAIAGCQTFLNSGLLDQPEIIKGFRENVDVTEETKKSLNLLENVLHWMKSGAPPPEAVKGGAAPAIEKAAREYVAARRKAGAVRFGPGNAGDAFDADAAEDAAWTNLCVAVDTPHQAEAVKADPGAPSYFEPAEGVCACCRQVKLWHGPKGECPAPFPAMAWPGAPRPAALPTGAAAESDLKTIAKHARESAEKGSTEAWYRMKLRQIAAQLEALPLPTGADPRDLGA